MHLHADDHPAPNAELRRLVGVHRAYEHLEASEELRARSGDEAAVARERDGGPAPPDPTCRGSLLGGDRPRRGQGRIDEARELIAPAFAADPGWRELLQRLRDHDLLDVRPEAAQALLDDPPS